MQKAKAIHSCLVIASFALSMTAINPAWSQAGADPIGELKKTSTFDRARHVDIAKSSKGKPVCYFREEGSSHRLDIGLSADGAFIRVESGEGPLANESNFNPELPLVTRTNPKPPLRIFAAKGLTKVINGDVKSTGEYEPLQFYGGAVDYVPNIDTVFGEGFVLVTKGDTKSFLEMVTRARGEFIVVQSVAEPKNFDGVAIYGFKASTLAALLACAKKHIQ
jgi:hypothetical protein